MTVGVSVGVEVSVCVSVGLLLRIPVDGEKAEMAAKPISMSNPNVVLGYLTAVLFTGYQPRIRKMQSLSLT